MRSGKLIFTAIVALILSSLPVSVQAFSLLGPFPNWMSNTNLIRDPQDIGGPMQKSEAYRRNVSVLTYGFDKSFVDYFGPEGVDAVKSAIAYLNAVPPASRINVNHYSTSTLHDAGDMAVMDLRLVALNALLQQLGLAPPHRYVWTLRQWDPSLPPYQLDSNSMPPEKIAHCMAELNYDPKTLQVSDQINDVPFGFELFGFAPRLDAWVSVGWSQGNPLTIPNAPVSDGVSLDYGRNTAGPTRDDIGGLKFLLSSNNIRVEALDPSIFPLVTGGQTIPRTGPRPGVEKISFVKHPVDANGNFRVAKFAVTIPYLSRSGWKKCAGVRVVKRPDILFSAASLLTPSETWPNITYGLQYFRSTDTSQWQNNAALNNNPGGDGPGVITGPTEITFQTNTLAAWPEGAHWKWGMFLGSSTTNYVAFGPQQSN